MKVLARASQLSLSLDSVSLSPAVMERLQQRPDGGRPPYQTAAARGCRLALGGRRANPPTFFFRFRLPGEGEEASLCSRKVTASLVEFNQRKTIPVTFNSKVGTVPYVSSDKITAFYTVCR